MEGAIVSAGDTKLWAKYLGALPSENFSDQQLLNMAEICLTPCHLYGKPEMAKMVLKAFLGPDGDEKTMFVDLIRAHSFPETLARFLADIYNYPPAVILDDLVQSEDNDQMYWVAEVLNKVYPLQSYDTYVELYDHALAEGNRTLADYLHQKIVETNIAAAIPSYILPEPKNRQMPSGILATELLKIPEPIPFVFTMPETDDAAVRILNSNLDDHGIAATLGPELLKAGSANIDQDIFDTTLTEYRKLPRESKEAYVRAALMENWVVTMADNIAFRRFFGPLNAQAFDDFHDQNHICYKWGGCPMFGCVCNQTIDDTDQFDLGEIDWFTGSCFRCKQIIKKRWYAVRKPFVAGGWDRCFCSWEHVRISVKERPDQDTPQVLELIDTYEEQIKISGIYDRPEKPIFPFLSYPEQQWSAGPIRVVFEGFPDQRQREQEEEEVVVISS